MTLPYPVAESNGEPPPVRIVGHGPVRVVVSHGWIADHTLFEPFIRGIDEAAFTYAFVDARGYGRRRDAAGPWTIEAMAADVLAVADDRRWARFHVLGHSMGGMAAQRLLIDAPARLETAVLIAPVPASGARIEPARRELLRRAIQDPGARRELINRNTGQRQAREWLDELLELSVRTTRSEALEAYMDSWSDTDFSSEVRETHVPLLVIVGDLDPGASMQRMESTFCRWHPHTVLESLSNTGHYPMRECPDRLHAVLTRHFGARDVRLA